MVFYFTLLFASLGAILAIVSGIVGWGFLPGFIEDAIAENLALNEGTETFEAWKNPPFPINFSVYMFEILNPDAFMDGAKAEVRERGPYIYKEYREKYNISETSDTLGFLERQLYEFDKEASYPNTEDDSMNVLNLAMNTVTQLTEGNPLSVLLNRYLARIFNSKSLVMNVTPRQLLFEGFPFCENGPDIICDQIKNIEMENIEIKNGIPYFSILGNKNNSNNGHFVIKRGNDDIQNLGMIETWNYASRMNIWPERYGNDSSCNDLFGTDSSIFPPFLEKEKNISMFIKDVCRSVSTMYQETVEIKGIKAYRYLGTIDLVPAPSIEDGTICLCSNFTKGINQENGCLMQGVVDLYPCTGAPLVLSFPHMYQANEAYSNSVIGLTPEAEKHRIVLEINPLTGIPLRASNRVQFNMFARPIKGYTVTKNLATTLVPALWFEEGFVLPDDKADELKSDLFDMLDMIVIIKWSLLSVGLATFIVFTGLFIYVKRRQSNASV